MKNLSNFAKSNIFLLLSVAVAASAFWVDFYLQDTLWGILLAFGYYYWGKDRGIREAQRKTPKNYTINLYADKQTVVG